jgi:hypothetical protein
VLAVKRRRVLLLSVGVLAVAATAAVAAPEISPSSLVAHPRELPGFASAKVKLATATSASRYAKDVLHDGSREARKEVAKLKRDGFREGVQELLRGSQGEALSSAVVFRSPARAQHELKASVAEAVKAQGRSAVIKRFTVATIPGSFGFSATEAGHPGGAANLLFASGRCFFILGDALKSAPPEQLSVAPIAGATALYRRVTSLCG